MGATKHGVGFCPPPCRVPRIPPHHPVPPLPPNTCPRASSSLNKDILAHLRWRHCTPTTHPIPPSCVCPLLKVTNPHVWLWPIHWCGGRRDRAPSLFSPAPLRPHRSSKWPPPLVTPSKAHPIYLPGITLGDRWRRHRKRWRRRHAPLTEACATIEAAARLARHRGRVSRRPAAGRVATWA